MDWESLYCPNRHGWYDGRPFFQGQLVKNGRSHGQQQAQCRACETHVSIRYGTASLDLHADPAIFETAVRHERKAIRSERRHASSTSTKKPCVHGWIERPNTADW